MVLGKKEGLVECATVQVKSVVILRTVLLRFGLRPITSTLRTKRTFVRQSASAKNFGPLSTDILTNQNKDLKLQLGTYLNI